MGNPLSCRPTSQKIASLCAQARVTHLSIYTGNERAIILFLLFETLVVAVLAGINWFCCIFWRKKKLQDQDLGKFLEKRNSLRVKKKEFNRTISELEQKVAEEAVGNEVLEKLGQLVREREGIERKLSTTYSLGRDTPIPQTKSVLPLYGGKTKSYSFQGRKKESVTIFHTLSDTSSIERSTSYGSESNDNSNGSSHPEEAESYYYYGEESSEGKANTPGEVGPSRIAEMGEETFWKSPLDPAKQSEGLTKPLVIEPTFNEWMERKQEKAIMGTVQKGSSTIGNGNFHLKRRRSLSLASERNTD